ncbi:MAG: hypothetical protein JXR55_00140 [Candidatus Fermentibacteraceae bacterium]|nr:hypothetical protein [Candidatus Fermentibacteraceae bacterium]
MIVYGDSDPDEFKYAWFDGMTWNIETFWTEAGNGLDAAVDDSGGLHVCFSKTFSENLVYYGCRDSSGWTFVETGQATLTRSTWSSDRTERCTPPCTRITCIIACGNNRAGRQRRWTTATDSKATWRWGLAERFT